MNAKPPTKTAVVSEEWPIATSIARRRALTSRLMEQAVEPDDLNQAYARAIANRGSPEIDGMRVDQLADWIRQQKPQARP